MLEKRYIEKIDKNFLILFIVAFLMILPGLLRWLSDGGG